MTKGGKRKGAGRPPLGKERGKTFAVWLQPDLIEWINQAAVKAGLNKSRFVSGILERERDTDR